MSRDILGVIFYLFYRIVMGEQNRRPISVEFILGKPDDDDLLYWRTLR
jgi:hypothetical protein